MRKIDLSTVVRATEAKVFSTFEKEFSGLGTDTRKDLTGQLFIALKGEAFDAHDYLDQAVAKGAKALLVHRFPENLESLRSKVTMIVVKDTLKALQDLAHYTRKMSKSTILGITGSNGKTTSKEFAAAVISTQKKVHYSKGSFNNHWGLPFSLLEQDDKAEVSILEMGMNHAGEIKRLCEIAEPDVVVCTVVGRAHIEHFDGQIEGIANAKEEIYESAPTAARRIYNLDNPWTQKMFLRSRQRFPKADRILSFSQMNPKADVFLQIENMTMTSLSIKGRILKVDGQVEVPVFGAQNLTNLMVAASSALAVGMSAEDVWQGLAKCRTNWGRNQLLKTKSGAEVLFDGYNANPDSMTALLQNLTSVTAGEKIGVFAEMLELGPLASESHREIGEKAGAAGLNLIWFYGPHSQDFEAGVKASGYSGKLICTAAYDEKIAEQVGGSLKPGTLAAVKGSRGMKLERFVIAAGAENFSLDKS
jgi:UDP-N-acetylmuramoyl-tripeptide--D-alanyl-D-alanine ligase